jgi:hypothetical protein
MAMILKLHAIAKYNKTGLLYGNIRIETNCRA